MARGPKNWLGTTLTLVGKGVPGGSRREREPRSSPEFEATTEADGQTAPLLEDATGNEHIRQTLVQIQRGLAPQPTQDDIFRQLRQLVRSINKQKD